VGYTHALANLTEARYVMFVVSQRQIQIEVYQEGGKKPVLVDMDPCWGDPNVPMEILPVRLVRPQARIDQELAALKNQLNTKPSIMRNQPRVAGRGVRSTPPRRRGRLTPAGRRQLSELARKRWIMNRKLGKKTL